MNTVVLILFCAFIAEASLLPAIDKSTHRWVLAANEDRRLHMADLKPIHEAMTDYNPMDDIIFLLFTRNNPLIGQRITFDMNTVVNSNWNPANDVRFILHGWTGSAESEHNIFLTREFLRIADHNVVVIDWSAGAQTPNYITARNNVGPTGVAAGRFIDALVAAGLTEHIKVNVVGHSLGSHVAGHMGKTVTTGRINAIFATDPSGPLFNINDPGQRLDFDDAVYTEAIHTNVGQFGFDEPIAHATFYPNWGGPVQPGCGTLDTNCSHRRSNHLYSESLTSDRLVGRQCAGYHEIVAQNCPGNGVTAILGGDQVKSLRGVFFLQTNAQSPFGMG